MSKQINGTNDLEAIVKWPGGKTKELSHIIGNAPAHFDTLYEPFVGGGSVYMAIPAKNYKINDASIELINLYRCIKDKDKEFYHYAQGMVETWANAEKLFASYCSGFCKIYADFRSDSISQSELAEKVNGFVNQNSDPLKNILSEINTEPNIFLAEMKRNTLDKMKRMKKIEAQRGILCKKDLHDNIETCFKASVYMYYRTLYNKNTPQRSPALQTALFFFLRNYAYSGMFRFSNKGDFNVPYGGIAYNSKQLKNKLNYYQSGKVIEHFSRTEIFNMDFEDFLENNPPATDDFIFLDPPYDSEFSTYDKNEFGRRDQERLADYLINRCNGRWLMIIKSTEFIYNLYAGQPGITIMTFDKEYLVSFMNRNEKHVKHLIIKNY